MDMKVGGVGKLWLSGVTYGAGLTCLGIMAAGAGHGTYLLLGIASAPLSFLGIPLSIISPPLLWGLVGWLLSRAERGPQRQIVPALFLVHYAAILLMPLFEDYAEGKYIAITWAHNPVILILGAGVYLLGQGLMWGYWFRLRTKRRLA
jgi:hypothetical protein